MLNKKCALKKRVFQTDVRADYLERIVRAFRGFTELPKFSDFDYCIGKIKLKSIKLQPVFIQKMI